MRNSTYLAPAACVLTRCEVETSNPALLYGDGVHRNMAVCEQKGYKYSFPSNNYTISHVDKHYMQICVW